MAPSSPCKRTALAALRCRGGTARPGGGVFRHSLALLGHRLVLGLPLPTVACATGPVHCREVTASYFYWESSRGWQRTWTAAC